MTSSGPAPSPVFSAGSEIRRLKGEKVTRAIRTAGLDGILVLKPEAIRYATDFYAKGYRRFIEVEYCLVANASGRQALGYTSGSDEYRLPHTSFLEDTRRLRGSISTMLHDFSLSGKRVGFDLMPYELGTELRRLDPALQLVPAEHLWEEVSAAKDPLEVQAIRAAYDVLALGISAGMAAAVAGVRELDVAAEIEYAMRKAGNEMTPAITLVASGRNGAIFERIATDRVIGEGELVIIDVTAVVSGYTADAARTVLSSGVATSEQRSMYGVVRAALDAAIAAVKPGATCDDIDAAARSCYEASNWAQYGSRWATGHQIGFGLHGTPLVAAGVDAVIEPNMVMCLEPRLHAYDRPELGGVQVEDAVVVTDDGAEVISAAIPYCAALEA
jgi:Xaa-Pro aminopeptidase